MPDDQLQQMLVDPSQFAADWTNLETQVSVPAGQAAMIVSASPRRISLMMSAQANGFVTIGLNSTVQAGNGFLIPVVGGVWNIRFCYQQDAGLCQAEWWLLNNGFGPMIASVIQSLWLPQV